MKIFLQGGIKSRKGQKGVRQTIVNLGISDVVLLVAGTVTTIIVAFGGTFALQQIFERIADAKERERNMTQEEGRAVTDNPTNQGGGGPGYRIKKYKDPRTGEWVEGPLPKSYHTDPFHGVAPIAPPRAAPYPPSDPRFFTDLTFQPAAATPAPSFDPTEGPIARFVRWVGRTVFRTDRDQQRKEPAPDTGTVERGEQPVMSKKDKDRQQGRRDIEAGVADALGPVVGPPDAEELTYAERLEKVETQLASLATLPADLDAIMPGLVEARDKIDPLTERVVAAEHRLAKFEVDGDLASAKITGRLDAIEANMTKIAEQVGKIVTAINAHETRLNEARLDEVKQRMDELAHWPVQTRSLSDRVDEVVNELGRVSAWVSGMKQAVVHELRNEMLPRLEANSELPRMIGQLAAQVESLERQLGRPASRRPAASRETFTSEEVDRLLRGTLSEEPLFPPSKPRVRVIEESQGQQPRGKSTWRRQDFSGT